MLGFEKAKVKAQEQAGAMLSQVQVEKEVVFKVRSWKLDLKLAMCVKKVDLGWVWDYPCPSKKELGYLNFLSGWLRSLV